LTEGLEEGLIGERLQRVVLDVGRRARRRTRRVGGVLEADLGEQQRLADLRRDALEILDQRLISGDVVGLRRRTAVDWRLGPAGDELAQRRVGRVG